MTDTEVVAVMCPTDKLICRVRRPLVCEHSSGSTVEVLCRGCRDVLRNTPAFHTLRRSEIGVYHFVDPTTARIAETLVVLFPRPGSDDANHGGRVVPDAAYIGALKTAGY